MIRAGMLYTLAFLGSAPVWGDYPRCACTHCMAFECLQCLPERPSIPGHSVCLFCGPFTWRFLVSDWVRRILRHIQNACVCRYRKKTSSEVNRVRSLHKFCVGLARLLLCWLFLWHIQEAHASRRDSLYHAWRRENMLLDNTLHYAGNTRSILIDHHVVIR
jgi:hypothetical protein